MNDTSTSWYKQVLAIHFLFQKYIMMDTNISEIQIQLKYDAYASALWYRGYLSIIGINT